MLAIRSFAIALLAMGFFLGTSAQAQVLYQGQWIAESFGTDNLGGTEEDAYFSILGVPMGNNCNQFQPACTISETPTNGVDGMFSPRAGRTTPLQTPNCRALTVGEMPRPAKGAM